MSNGYKIKPIHILVIAILAFGAWYSGLFSLSIGNKPVTPNPPTQTQNQLTVNKPLKFSLNDPLKGAAIASATVYIYGPDKVLRETLTTASDGTITSALPYQSDSTLYVKVSKALYVTRWFTVTVPKMTQADAESLTTNYVPLQTYTLGTYTIKATDQFGNVYSTGNAMNFTTLGASTVTLNVGIYNTVDNTGYLSSSDYLNGIRNDAVFRISTTGSSVGLNGVGNYVMRGTTSYWSTTIPDDSLTRQLVGTQYTKSGVGTLTITLTKGTLAGNQTITCNLYDYSDPTYFATNGTGGPNEASIGSFSLILQG